MKSHQYPARGARPLVELLEARAMLSLSANWVGQDGTDLVGTDSPAPDGYQDIHVHLSGLTASQSISRIDIRRFSGGGWTVSGGNNDNAILARSGSSSAGWSTSADLYLEPYFNDPSGTWYESIQVTYANGSTDTYTGLHSTTAVDPNLRAPGKELTVKYVGQDGTDITGPGLTVGPDGIQDVHLRLSNLLTYTRPAGGTVNFNPVTDAVIVTMTPTGGSPVSWLAGPPPSWLTGAYQRAELLSVANDPTSADLYLNPVAGVVSGTPITVQVVYNSIGKTDISPKPSDRFAPPAALVSPSANATLAAPAPPAPAYPVSFSGPTATWVGQDGTSAAVPGVVHVGVTGLPVGWSFADASLSDNNGHIWTPGNQDLAQSLTIKPGTNPTTADLTFLPLWDEIGAAMTFRLRLAGSSVQYVSQFTGGFADPTLRDPRPASTSITVDPTFVAQPGHDLNTLVRSYGTVHLKAGTYPLSVPLDLANPVSLVGDAGSVLSFSQPSSASPWSYAIKIDASHTTLDGLTVRFATTVRWGSDFQRDPAVIGLGYGPSYTPGSKVDINLRNLDLRYSPTPGELNSFGLTNVRLIRSGGEDSGTITGNTLRGGMVELRGGPWQVANNDQQGTDPGSALGAAFVIHGGNRVTLTGNHVHTVGASGVTFGFLVLTDGGSNITVSNNLVDGNVGRDASVLPYATYNLSDIVLTESYAPHYEGIAFVSPTSRRLLAVPTLRGNPPTPGDVVAILTGPYAGSWLRISQVLDAHNYVIDGDLPAGSFAVSITRGYLNNAYLGNTFDLSALKESSGDGFRLLGPQFGTTVTNNTVIGCQPFYLTSVPTESSAGSATPFPAAWGWSHTPVFSLVVSGNTFKDPALWDSYSGRAVSYGVLGVEHGPAVAASGGRLYMTVSFTNNLFSYSDAFLAGTNTSFIAANIGDPGAIDQGELNISSLSGNAFSAPDSFVNAGRSIVFKVDSGTVAGQTGAQMIALSRNTPPPPPPPSAPASMTATSLGQDGHDLVGPSASYGPDGIQDVHIVIGNLRTDAAVVQVDVFPFGYGHWQYVAPGAPPLPASHPNTPDRNAAFYRAAFVRPSQGSKTADLYVPSLFKENGYLPGTNPPAFNHYDIVVTYADGTTASASAVKVVDDPTLKQPVGTASAGTVSAPIVTVPLTTTHKVSTTPGSGTPVVIPTNPVSKPTAPHNGTGRVRVRFVHPTRPANRHRNPRGW